MEDEEEEAELDHIGATQVEQNGKQSHEMDTAALGYRLRRIVEETVDIRHRWDHLQHAHLVTAKPVAACTTSVDSAGFADDLACCVVLGAQRAVAPEQKTPGQAVSSPRLSAHPEAVILTPDAPTTSSPSTRSLNLSSSTLRRIFEHTVGI